MATEALPPLFAITDRALAPDGLLAIIERVVAATPGGVAIQVREKDMGAPDLLALVRDVVAVARPARCPVLVNGRLDVAVAAGADGVHLPEAGMGVSRARKLASDLGLDGFVIGCSTHDAQAAVAAARAGADLVMLGPVWPTPKKIALGRPLGLAPIAAAATALAREKLPARLYAVGGIDSAARADEARAAGAYGVAAIRAIWQAENPASAVTRLSGRPVPARFSATS